MFPHLLKSGNGTTDLNQLSAIDSQAGVIVINGKIQKPMNSPLTAHLKSQSQVSLIHNSQVCGVCVSVCVRACVFVRVSAHVHECVCECVLLAFM